MAYHMTDQSFNPREVNAATDAIIRFAGDVIELVNADELIELLNNQLCDIWHILDENVRASIIVTTFAEYDIDLVSAA